VATTLRLRLEQLDPKFVFIPANDKEAGNKVSKMAQLEILHSRANRDIRQFCNHLQPATIRNQMGKME
jgi:hypothetical protein